VTSPPPADSRQMQALRYMSEAMPEQDATDLAQTVKIA
jgi:hypothetical protein